jgi:two-component system, cell cycle sensor histidine kinase PleC
VRERAEIAGLALTSEIAPNLPALSADNRLLKQILLNLLSNALKFTERGGTVNVGAALGAGESIDIRVKDTGIGMSADEIAVALTPFAQVDSKLARAYEGTGLGLPLVKSFVELHGGSLAVASEPGAGTVVTVRFPPAPPTKLGEERRAAE